MLMSEGENVRVDMSEVDVRREMSVGNISKGVPEGKCLWRNVRGDMLDGKCQVGYIR